jgi:hypothetical protein
MDNPKIQEKEEKEEKARKEKERKGMGESDVREGEEEKRKKRRKEKKEEERESKWDMCKGMDGWGKIRLSSPSQPGDDKGHKGIAFLFNPQLP